MRGRNLFPLVGLLFLVATCTDDTRLPTSPLDSGPSPSISTMDAGDYIFQFLDPLGPAEPPEGIFDPGANPRVEVCPRDNGVDCGRKPVAELFVGGKGPRQLNVMDGSYEGQWHVKPNLDPSLTYQISVLIGDTEIGSIDTRFDVGADYQLTRGERLMIRFWLGTPPSGTTETIGPDGGQVTLGDDVTLDFPEGALNEDTDITVEPAEDVAGAISGTVYSFGPDGAVFSVPVLLQICYDPAHVGGANEAELRLVRVLEGGALEETGNSGVDLGNHCVFGDVNGFSTFAAAVPPPPPDPDPDFAVVVLGQGDGFTFGSLKTINPANNSLVGTTIQNLNAPWRMFRIPNNDAAWVANRGDGTLVRCGWGAEGPLANLTGCGNAPIEGFGDPVAIAFPLNAFNQMLVVDKGGDQVLIRTPEGAGAGSVAVSGSPMDIVALPNGLKAYVAADGFVDVLSIDQFTGVVSVSSSISLGERVGQAITASPDGSSIYVAAFSLDPDDNPMFGALYRINTTTDVIDGAVLEIHNFLNLEPLLGIVVNQAGTTAYVGGMGPLYVVDLAAWAIADAWELAVGATQFLAFSPDETEIWATSSFDFQVGRIDIATQSGTQFGVGDFMPRGGLLVIPIP